MARTFDIRFARSDGIAALLATPANTFRWRGAGSLRIDGSRLDIRQKPGIHTLLTRHTHFRLNAADLREVAREGDALRIEFGVPGTRRGVLPFWVRDRKVAEEIVRLMPTDRTVETDEAVETPVAPKRRHSPAAFIGVALVSLIIGVVGTSRLVGESVDETPLPTPEATVVPAADSFVPEVIPEPIGESTAPGARSTRVDTTERALPAARTIASSPTITAAPVVAALREGADVSYVESSTTPMKVGAATAVTPTQAPYLDPDFEARRFMREAMALRSAYIYGNSPADLERQWWELSVRLYDSPAFAAGARNILVDVELGLSLNWRASLANYSAALAAGNRERIEAARADLERADQLTDETAFAFGFR